MPVRVPDAAAPAGPVSAIVQAPQTVSAADCARLVDIVKRHETANPCRDVQGHAVVHVFDPLLAAEDRHPVLLALRRCMDRIGEHVPLCTQRFFPETVAVTVLDVGGFHMRHVDNRRQDETGAWVPNHTPMRTLSALLYLNGDFDGGEIVLDRQGLVIKPQTGMLLAFPSGPGFPHEVRPVTRGRRYSMPMWFTSDPRHALLREPIRFAQQVTATA